MKTIIAGTILLLNILTLKGHCENKQDSLRSLIQATRDNTEKVKFLRSLCEIYLGTNNFEAIKVATDLLNISISENNIKGIIFSYKVLGYSYYKNKNYNKALENYFFAISYLKNYNDSLDLAKTYKEIALIYTHIEDAEKALYYNDICHKMLERIDDKDLLIKCYQNYAYAYRLLKNSKEEIKYLYKSIELGKRNKSKLSLEHNSLAFGYWKLNKYDSALKYFNSYLNDAYLINDSVAIARAYSNIGSTYYSLGDYSTSIKYLNSALKLEQDNIAHVYNELTLAYLKLSDIKKATNYFQMALKHPNADLSELDITCNLIIDLLKKGKMKDDVVEYSDISRGIKDTLYSRSKFEFKTKAKSSSEGIEKKVEEKREIDSLRKSEEENSFKIILLSIIGLIFGILIILIFRNYTKKMRLQNSVIAEQNNKIEDSNKKLEEIRRAVEIKLQDLAKTAIRMEELAKSKT